MSPVWVVSRRKPFSSDAVCYGLESVPHQKWAIIFCKTTLRTIANVNAACVKASMACPGAMASVLVIALCTGVVHVGGSLVLIESPLLGLVGMVLVGLVGRGAGGGGVVAAAA